jgi:hypothetical protein
MLMVVCAFNSGANAQYSKIWKFFRFFLTWLPTVDIQQSAYVFRNGLLRTNYCCTEGTEIQTHATSWHTQCFWVLICNLWNVYIFSTLIPSWCAFTRINGWLRPLLLQCQFFSHRRYENPPKLLIAEKCEYVYCGIRDPLLSADPVNNDCFWATAQ